MDEGKEIRFIDQFSGIGGFRKGLERAGGFRHVWSCDNNKYANQVYTKQFGEEGHHTGDIRGVDPEEIPNFDFLCAGFPCQAFSSAGKREGFKDTRGTLFFEICRIAEAKKPSLLLLENVKGLLNHDGGRTFTIVLQTLDELGYWIEWQVLNSKHHGVPQNRERVFIIGHLRGSGGREIFPINYDGPTTAETDEEKHGQITNTITGGNASGFNARGNYILAPKVAGTLTGGGHSGGLHSDMTVIAVSRTNPHYRGEKRTASYSPIVRAIKPRWGNQDPIVKQGSIFRRLTPIECERLQGFPDDWTKWGHLENNIIEYEDIYGERVILLEGNDLEGGPEERTIWTVIGKKELGTPLEDTVQVSDTQRYKCLGNAVTVNIIEFLGKKIKEIWNQGSEGGRVT